MTLLHLHHPRDGYFGSSFLLMRPRAILGHPLTPATLPRAPPPSLVPGHCAGAGARRGVGCNLQVGSVALAYHQVYFHFYKCVRLLDHSCSDTRPSRPHPRSGGGSQQGPEGEVQTHPHTAGEGWHISHLCAKNEVIMLTTGNTCNIYLQL